MSKCCNANRLKAARVILNQMESSDDLENHGDPEMVSADFDAIKDEKHSRQEGE
jgi:pentatricopeptide repeat protein